MMIVGQYEINATWVIWVAIIATLLINVNSSRYKNASRHFSPP